MTFGSSGAVLISYAVGVGATCLLTPLARRLIVRAAVMDEPEARKVHTKAVPTAGGVALFFGFLLAAWAGGAHHQMGAQVLLAVIAGAVLVTVVGFVDDRRGISAKTKLLLQVLCTIPLLIGGVTISVLSHPFRPDMILLPQWLAAFLTIGWVVGVTNAINLIDGLDGLAAGVSAIACVALAIIALGCGQPAVALLCAALAGSALGFLPWNWHPAGIIMGDTGAYFLGYMIAAVTILGAFKMAAAIAIFVPMLVLAVPLLDTVLSPVRRYLNGRPAFAADRDHLHHRLMALGLSTPRVVMLTYVVTALCGAIAVWISRAG